MPPPFRETLERRAGIEPAQTIRRCRSGKRICRILIVAVLAGLIPHNHPFKVFCEIRRNTGVFSSSNWAMCLAFLPISRVLSLGCRAGIEPACRHARGWWGEGGRYAANPPPKRGGASAVDSATGVALPHRSGPACRMGIMTTVHRVSSALPAVITRGDISLDGNIIATG